MNPLLSVDALRQILFEKISPLNQTEMLPLSAASGRILATDCLSPVAVPPADNSAMDGYALYVSDNQETQNKIWPVSQSIAAGSVAQTLLPDTAARILTGAEIPEGANSVVIQENCEEVSGGIKVLCQIKPGDNIRPKGQDIQQNDVIAPAGTCLFPSDIGVLASCGIAEVLVRAKITVGLISTGTELVEPGAPLKAGQIYNSNQYFLSALLQNLSCEVKVFPIVEDTLPATISSLKAAARECDFLITSGGVSVGDEDHIKTALQQLGSLELWKVNMKPGKPVAFGFIESGVPVLGLPGNPVSAYVTFLFFGKLVLEKLFNRPFPELKSFEFPAGFDLTTPKKRPEYIRVILDNNRLIPFARQSSGVLTSIQRSSGLALIEADKLFAEGDALAYFPYERLQQFCNDWPRDDRRHT